MRSTILIFAATLASLTGALFGQDGVLRYGNVYEGRNPDRVYELYSPEFEPPPLRRAPAIERFRVPYNPDPELNPHFNFYGGLFDDYRELSDFYAVPGGYRRYDVFGPGSAYNYNPYDDNAYFRSRYFDFYTDDVTPYEERAQMFARRREILTRERVREPQAPEFRLELPQTPPDQ